MNLETLPRFPCWGKAAGKELYKKPITWHGFKDARVHRNVKGWPLVGIPTGKRTGFDVLDIDPEGIAWFNEMPIPATRHQMTRRGLHLYFEHSPGLRNSGSKIVPGVDVRGDGGFCIDWSREGFDCLWPERLAPWPAWLLELARGTLERTRHPVQGPGGDQSLDGDTPDGGGIRGVSSPTSSVQFKVAQSVHYPSTTKNFQSRCKWNIRRLASQIPGGRNEKLFEVACDFAEIIAEGRILPSVATHLMLGACKANGLIEDYGKAKCLSQIANAYRIIEEREL